MRFLLVISVVVKFATGASPGTSRERPELVAILRSLVSEHPTWTTHEVYTAAQPLLASAGLPPVGFHLVRRHMIQTRKDLNPSHEVFRFTPEQSAYLKSQRAENPAQKPKAVVAKFQAMFGQDAVSPQRVSKWWTTSRRSFRYVRTNEGLPVKIANGPVNLAPLTAEMDAFVRAQVESSKGGYGFHEAYAVFVNKFGPDAPDRSTVQATWWAHHGRGGGVTGAAGPSSQ